MTNSYLRLNRLFWWCALAAVPNSLYAAAVTDSVDSIRPVNPGRLLPADGVVYIDQNRALGGGVTPGDTAGFPVTISQSGSYRLSGNLTVPDLNTTAIEITADFVTLDLNGFSIIGPAVCTTGAATMCPSAGKGIGVLAGGDKAPFPRGVRILNGSVRGMGLWGIQLNGSGSFVERVIADSNAGGGMSVAGTVVQSAATQNGSFGVIANTVRDSTVLQNVGDGIVLAINGGVATGNISSLNGGSGIDVQIGTATTNTLFLNHNVGILAVCPSAIVNNTIVTNGPVAIQTSEAGCALADNGTHP